MKISLNNVRELITALGFLPEDGRDNIYYKSIPGMTVTSFVSISIRKKLSIARTL